MVQRGVWPADSRPCKSGRKGWGAACRQSQQDCGAFAPAPPHPPRARTSYPRVEAGCVLALGPPPSADGEPFPSPSTATPPSSATPAATATAAPAAAPTLYAVAAAGDGALHCLDLATGRRVGRAVDCGGEFKAPPESDPWLGAVWAASHGRRLTVRRAAARSLEACSRACLAAPCACHVAPRGVAVLGCAPPRLCGWAVGSWQAAMPV